MGPPKQKGIDGTTKINVRQADKETPTPIGFGHMTSPEQTANIFSLLTFWWANRLPLFAYKNVLQMEHLWEVCDHDLANSIYNEIQPEWEKQKKLETPSFGTALWATYKWYYLRCFFFMCLSVGATLAQPELLSRLTVWVTKKKYDIPVDDNSGYLYAMGMFLVAMFGSFCTYQANYSGIRAGSKLRSAVVTNVYRKALRLSNAAKGKTSQGNIKYIMANDAQRLVDTSVFLNNVIASPVQVVGAIILLWFKIGWPTFVALGFMICAMPVNGYAAKKMGAFRWGMVQKSDFRVKITTEIIQFIKIKLYAWEDSFAQKVIAARLSEILFLRQFNIIRSMLISIITSVPTVSAILMYCAYWGSGHALNPAVVFSSLSYLNALALPFNFMPFLAALIAQMKVATARVTTFMLYDEIVPLDEITDPAIPAPALKIIDADFNWDVPPQAPEGAPGGGPPGAGGPPGGGPPGPPGGKKKKAPKQDFAALPPAKNQKYAEFTLRDLTLDFVGPQLVAVVGPVGSGKSSLCNSLLGEMKILKGKMAKKGTIAYVPQQAWIINASLRDNILFGLPYDEKKYNDVLEACALMPDLKILSAGDLTEIGERGINLSGGQKQRVSIARALYNDADIYIMDDPLSAVDAHVSKHLFYECIRRFLTKKLVILATNQLQFLPDILLHIFLTYSFDVLVNTDRVVVLAGNGNVLCQGHFKELIASNAQFVEMMTIAGGGGSQANEVEEKKKPEEVKVEEQKTSADGQLVHLEDRAAGSISWDVYYQYFKAGGLLKASLIFVLYCMASGLNVVVSWWLSHWSTATTSSPMKHPNYFYYSIYIALGVFYVLVSSVKAFSFFHYVTVAALNVHNKMFNTIIRAPMSFFDTTPLGRIINRFSKDVDQVDNMLQMPMDQTVSFTLNLIAAIIMIVIYVPVILAIVAPSVVLFLVLQKFYRNTSRELQRIESISRSPLFAQFSETLSGASSIRAYSCGDRMINTNERLLNNNNKAYFTLQAMNQWLGIRLDLIGNIIVFCTALFIIIFRSSLSPAAVGLSLSYALTLTGYLNKATVTSADFETKMNSVERIVETWHGPTEPSDSTATPNNPNWPTTGAIEFNNYKMRYRDGLDLVLRGITCSINHNEKIGIVGRTGAGKSSIVLALFRLVEAAEGSISLDHQDIAKIGLKTLRSRIAIIPQDPVLFSGTLRENLDPFTTMNDEEIWKVLEQIQLKDAAEKAGGLQAPVNENGENWSVGQRQIICLCRALLRKPKILVLDEATASVDSYTDALIQKTIRTEFSDATIITIAHRLNTIMDSSRIIVMDKGTVAEFDAPAILMDNPSSHLNWLVDQTGPQNAEVLRNIAYGRATVV